MKKGVLPRSGIDTDARWAIVTKWWVFKYKLHLTCTTGDLVVPLTADVTTANVQDNKMYVTLTSSFSVSSLPTLRYMTADPGYNDKKLYEYSKKTLCIDIICPVKRYKFSQREA